MDARPPLRGARPICAKCHLREAESYRDGAWCKPCIQNALRARRQLIEQATLIAGELYKRDAARFGTCFEFIKSSAKKRERADDILGAMKSLYQRETGSNWGDLVGAKNFSPNPVVDVRYYLGGTLRRLKIAREAKTVREGRGGDEFVKNILGKIQQAAEAVNAKRGGDGDLGGGGNRHSRGQSDRGRHRGADHVGAGQSRARLGKGGGDQPAGDRRAAVGAVGATAQKRRAKVLPDDAGDQKSLF